MNEEFKKLHDRFPFLTYGIYLDEDFIGIVQNVDAQFISIYDLNEVPTDLRAKFLEDGETWWWESNRKVPINMFLGEEFKIFDDCLKTFIVKEFDRKMGPIVCLDDMMEKRVKRRSIQLVKRVDD